MLGDMVADKEYTQICVTGIQRSGWVGLWNIVNKYVNIDGNMIEQESLLFPRHEISQLHINWAYTSLIRRYLIVGKYFVPYVKHVSKKRLFIAQTLQYFVR